MAGVLTVERISQSFGDTTVLRDVSFEVPRQSIVAVVGPNGSGKTTLVRLVAGLSIPTSGTVTLRTDRERPVGYLPQSPSFLPTATVGETIAFYQSLLDADPDPEAALARVGLGDVSGRRVVNLSGGMRRLLGLAVAMLGRPQVLVLDEPTSGLDPAMTDRFFGIVRQLQEDGTTVLVTTHRLSQLEDATKLLVLNRGSILADGTPADLRERTGAEELPAAFQTLVDESGPQTGAEEES
jgi:ABC-type multidrug transport system ATPase subunit